MATIQNLDSQLDVADSPPLKHPEVCPERIADLSREELREILSADSRAGEQPLSQHERQTVRLVLNILGIAENLGVSPDLLFEDRKVLDVGGGSNTGYQPIFSRWVEALGGIGISMDRAFLTQEERQKLGCGYLTENLTNMLLYPDRPNFFTVLEGLRERGTAVDEMMRLTPPYDIIHTHMVLGFNRAPDLFKNSSAEPLSDEELERRFRDFACRYLVDGGYLITDEGRDRVIYQKNGDAMVTVPLTATFW